MLLFLVDLARKTSQCQNPKGLTPAAQGLCRQHQSFLPADKQRLLGHIQAALQLSSRKTSGCGRPGAAEWFWGAQRAGGGFKPGLVHRSRMPAVPRKGQGCCSSSPSHFPLIHLSSPAPAPVVLPLLSLAWELPEVCSLPAWNPCGIQVSASPCVCWSSTSSSQKYASGSYLPGRAETHPTADGNTVHQPVG